MLAYTGTSTCSRRRPHRREVWPCARGRPRAVEQQLRQVGEQGEALGRQGRARRRGRQQRQPLRRRAQRLRRHGGDLWGLRGTWGFLGIMQDRRRAPWSVLRGRRARRVWRVRIAPARRQRGQVRARGPPGGGAAAGVRGAGRRWRGAGREQRGCQRLQVLPAVEPKVAQSRLETRAAVAVSATTRRTPPRFEASCGSMRPCLARAHPGRSQEAGHSRAGESPSGTQVGRFKSLQRLPIR